MEKYNDTLAHSGNYRYYAKEGKGANARYFYSKEEYDAWRNGSNMATDDPLSSQQDQRSRSTLRDKSTMRTKTTEERHDLFGRALDARSTTTSRDARISYVQQARSPRRSPGSTGSSTRAPGLDPTNGVSMRWDSAAQAWVPNSPTKNMSTKAYTPTYTMPTRNTVPSTNNTPPTETRYQRIINDEIANGTYKPQRDDPGRYNDTRKMISLSPDYQWNSKYLSEQSPSIEDQAIYDATIRANSTGPAYAETSATAAQKFVGDTKRSQYAVSSVVANAAKTAWDNVKSTYDTVSPVVANAASKAVQSAGNTIGSIKNYASQVCQAASSWIQNLLKKK